MKSLRLSIFAAVIAIAGLSPVFADDLTIPTTFYQSLNTTLQADVSAWDGAISAEWNGTKTGALFSAELTTGNGNGGIQLLSTTALTAAGLELDELKSMGLNACTVAVPFPLLYHPYYTWLASNGGVPTGTSGTTASPEAFITFYQNVVAMAHNRGMKVYMETGLIFPGVYSATSQLPVSNYYPSFGTGNGGLVAYLLARSSEAATTASLIRPDAIQLGAEPDTETSITGYNVNDPTVWADSVISSTQAIAATGVTGVKIGAGVPSWFSNAQSFLASLVAIDGLDFIDMHIYPINENVLANTLTYADYVNAHGKQIACLETWENKMTDAEYQSNLNLAADPNIFARDPFSFWEPLDQNFLKALFKFAYDKNALVVSGYWSRYFYAYLDYATYGSLSPTDVINQSLSAAAHAIVAKQISPTGQYFAQLANIIAPSVPGNVTATAVSETEIDISWTASSYPLSITGPSYAVYRNGVQISTVTATAYKDTGLVADSTYTYQVMAFDAGLNKSALSGSVTSVTSATLPVLSVRVYPNPWRADKYASSLPVTFDQLGSGSTVKIFDMAGHWVKTLTPSTTSAAWDRTNDSGNLVASGLYLYLITDHQGHRTRGKLTIIK